MQKRWSDEKLFFSGDAYFSDLINDLQSAKRSIELESYIFENDLLGKRIASELMKASMRGVKVRVLVDGIGSPFWAEAFLSDFLAVGIRAQIFHPRPLVYFQYLQKPRRFSSALHRFISLVGKLNKRNHQKLCVIDSRVAYVGGLNVSSKHLNEVYGSQAWRDTGFRVKGEQIKDLRRIFLANWIRKTKILRRLWSDSTLEELPKKSLYRFNATRAIRKRYYKDLIERLLEAENQIQITNAYFVPHRSFVSALRYIAQTKKAKVEIILPKYSDIFFIPWVSRIYYYALLKSGVSIYEYSDSFLHAKTLLIDNYATIGSSNLNHRSLIHDFELDLVASHPETHRQLMNQFEKDKGRSIQVTLKRWESRSWFEKILSSLFFFLRYFL